MNNETNEIFMLKEQDMEALRSIAKKKLDGMSDELLLWFKEAGLVYQSDDNWLLTSAGELAAQASDG